MPDFAPARGASFGALTLLLAACGGDDGPTGPSPDFDIVGQWSWRVTNASGSNVTCSVTNVTLTFTRTNGQLSGTRFSPGGGNLTCTSGSNSTTGNFTTNTAIQALAHSGTSISFEFTTNLGAWVMTGAITGDNTMGGSATIRVQGPSGGTVVLTGPWTATRS